MPEKCISCFSGTRDYSAIDQLPARMSVSLQENFFNCVNPCPCGHWGDTQKACTCAAAVVTKYQKRMSGPILDRIDIHIEVPRVEYEKLSGDRTGAPSTSIRQRVQAARDLQHTRFSSLQSQDIVCNADMRIGEIGLLS